MDLETEKFFRKHRITADRIKYILKEPDRCALYLSDGRVIYYYHALRDLLAALPEGEFLRVSRGIVLAGAQIREVSGREYTMADGRVFAGNKHDMAAHRRNGRMVEEAAEMRKHIEDTQVGADFAHFDDLPAPFFIIRPRKERDGCMDFIICYCNKAMADEERGLPETVSGRSVFEIFVSCDSRWLDIFEQVAKNGGSACIGDFRPGQGKAFTCRCYRVAPGYCGCLLV